MKKTLQIVLFTMSALLAGCGISEADVQATIAALPTQTAAATATHAPTSTVPAPSPTPGRQTAFEVSLSEIERYFKSEGLEGTGASTPCILTTTPPWAQCVKFYARSQNDIIEIIELIHDNGVLVGASATFFGGEPPVTLIDFVVHLKVPLVLFGAPVRDGDFYYLEFDGSDYMSHFWLDYRLAEVVCANPFFCQ
ncbi:MAG: hypothetical protein KIT08_01535 [Anaerolineales bacterium]|nr:MAG: hypothetical protein KIT08_01535 [Anaerolineales bacterium]